MARVNSSPTATVKPVEVELRDEKPVKTETVTVKKIISEPSVKKVIKTIEKKTVEKKSAAS